MSVILIMEDVNILVLILLVVEPVLVILDILWILINTVQVNLICNHAEYVYTCMY